MAVDMNKKVTAEAFKRLGDKVKELKVQVEDLATEGGEPNKITAIVVNGTLQTPDENKRVDLTVPTKTSDLTNDENYMTDTEVAAAIKAQVGGVLAPRGSCKFAELPALTAENVGGFYNVTDAFVTTADFSEGAGINCSAGTNVAIVEPSEGVYKYDLFGTPMDLSNYYTKEEIDEQVMTTTDIDEIMQEIFGDDA